MALDEQDKKNIKSMIDDSLAGAGEQFAQQARTAATEAIGEKVAGLERGLGDISAKVEQIGTGKGVDSEAISKLVEERVAAEMKVHGEKAAASAEQAAAKNKSAELRNAFLADKAAKIPDAYRSHIPETDSAEELQAGLDKAVAAMKADADKFGWKLPELGAAAGGGSNQAATERIAMDKMSPTQMIAAGLSESSK